MNCAIIVAMDQEWGIGKNNSLPWHLPDDLLFFKKTTNGHVVVMGRKNYESIPEKFRPLPNRENVVLTTNTNFKAPNCKIFHSLNDCLTHYEQEKLQNIFFIGGGELYRQILALNIINELYITHIDGSYNADVFFPKIDLTNWKQQIITSHEKDLKHSNKFQIVKYYR